MLKFLGASRQKLDDRGRFHLPVRWSEQVEAAGEMVLTAGPSGSLLLLEPDTWEGAARQIGFDVFCDPRRRRLRQLFVGHAEKVTADKAGRMQIAEPLRRYAGIDDLRAVYAVGTGNAIEIWSQEKWDEEMASTTSKPELFELYDPGSRDPDDESDV